MCLRMNFAGGCQYYLPTHYPYPYTPTTYPMGGEGGGVSILPTSLPPQQGGV